VGNASLELERTEGVEPSIAAGWGCYPPSGNPLGGQRGAPLALRGSAQGLTHTALTRTDYKDPLRHLRTTDGVRP